VPLDDVRAAGAAHMQGCVLARLRGRVVRRGCASSAALHMGGPGRYIPATVIID